MKKALFLAVSLFTILYFSSCRHCFTCMNECTQCIRYDSIFVTVYDTIDNVITPRDSFFMQERNNIHCTDDATIASREEYLEAIANDTTAHYTCADIAPTYTFDFCINKQGAKTYPSLHDHGGRAPCTEK